MGALLAEGWRRCLRGSSTPLPPPAGDILRFGIGESEMKQAGISFVWALVKSGTKQSADKSDPAPPRRGRQCPPPAGVGPACR